jgi:hemolysin activation/secretion protein
LHPGAQGTARSQAAPALLVQVTPPAALDSTLIAVTDIVVEGSTVYTSADFAPRLAAYRGKAVSPRQLQTLAQELTQRYRAAGYVLSKVVVLDQQVRNGVVRLQAQEGYIARVNIDGAPPRKRKALDGALAALKRARPLTAAALERNLLLINDLAGVTAAATLAPIDERASQLNLRFDQRSHSASVGVSNLGSRSRGRLRAEAEVEVYSLLGGFDRTRLRAVSSGNREMNAVALQHETPLGTNGLKGNVSVSGMNAKPGRSRKVNRNLETRSRDVVAGLSYPVVRSRGKNVNIKAALSAHDGAVDLPGLARTEDRIRALRVGANYDSVDRWQGVNNLEVELSQGLSALGASSNGAADLSRPGGRTDFTKLTVYAARLQSLREQWSLLGALNGQYAFNDLLLPEQFTFGGEYFGRGYDAAELAGDHGAAMKLELRYSGARAQSALNAYTLYGFYDAGKVWQRNASAARAEKASESAASAGLGARLDFGGNASAFVTLAKPLTREVAEEGNTRARLFAGANYKF